MEINGFIQNIENEIAGLESGTLTPDTDYRDIDQWSSMYALIIMAMIVIKYKVTLTGEDLKKTNTVRELFEHVKSKA
jgi:acyl carrier protein